MRISDIHCCAHVAVTEVSLNDLHVHVQRHQKRCAGVSEVVESDVSQTVLSEKRWEVRRDITRLNQLTEGIDTDHVRIFFAVGLAELLAVKLLSISVFKEDFLDLGNHFEASARAFGFHLIADHLHHFAVANNIQYLLPDKDFIVFEVDVTP